MIDAAQIRAARALLDVNQAQLSRLASVSATTIKRLEAASGIRGAAETLWKLQTALEKAGVEFIPADEQKGSGVRLKQRNGTKPKRGRSKVRLGLHYGAPRGDAHGGLLDLAEELSGFSEQALTPAVAQALLLVKPRV